MQSGLMGHRPYGATLIDKVLANAPLFFPGLRNDFENFGLQYTTAGTNAFVYSHGTC